jgi:hypothetical protein
MDGLSIFALILLILVFLVIAYGMIIIHDIPYHMAVKRNHPHQDAIHVGGWISLFTLHAIWPFLWIWATLYRPDRGYGFKGDNENELRERVSALETKLAGLEKADSSTTQE